MPIKNEREYRTMPLPLKTADKEEKMFDSDYVTVGYATTFDEPYLMYSYDGVDYYETISSQAIAEADMSDVIMQYDHYGKVFARQKNGTLRLVPDGHGLKVYADLSKSAASREMYNEIKEGLVDKMSWAFTIDDDEYDKETHTRTITKIRKVYDVSAVSIPANSDTEISARTYFNGLIESEKQELLEREKQIQRIRLKLKTEV